MSTLAGSLTAGSFRVPVEPHHGRRCGELVLCHGSEFQELRPGRRIDRQALALSGDFQRILEPTTNSEFEVQVWPSSPTCSAHGADTLPLFDTLSLANVDFGPSDTSSRAPMATVAPM